MERVLEKRLLRIVTVDEIQFGLLPKRGTIDAVFILRRQHEEHQSCQRSLMSKWQCTMDLCCHLFFLQLW